MIALLATIVIGFTTPRPESGVVLSSCNIRSTSKEFFYDVQARVTDPSIASVLLLTLYGDGQSEQNESVNFRVVGSRNHWVKSGSMSTDDPRVPGSINRLWCMVAGTFRADGSAVWQRSVWQHGLDLYDPSTLY
jgi:hypothetical protein